MTFARLKIPAVIGAACLGVLAVFSFFQKVGDAVNVPRRVEALERAQENLSRRMDTISVDVQRIQLGMDSSFRGINDTLARADSRAAESSASIKSLVQDVNEVRKVGMKIDNLQIQQDRLEERLMKQGKQ